MGPPLATSHGERCLTLSRSYRMRTCNFGQLKIRERINPDADETPALCQGEFAGQFKPTLVRNICIIDTADIFQFDAGAGFPISPRIVRDGRSNFVSAWFVDLRVDAGESSLIPAWVVERRRQ